MPDTMHNSPCMCVCSAQKKNIAWKPLFPPPSPCFSLFSPSFVDNELSKRLEQPLKMANFCAVAGMKRVHECLEKTDSISSLEAKKVLKVGVNENVDSDESLISAQDKSAECSEQCNTGKVLPHKAFIKMASNGDSAAEFENSADQNSPEGWEMPGEFRCLEEDHRSGVVECDCIAPPLTGPVFAGHNTQVTVPGSGF